MSNKPFELRIVLDQPQDYGVSLYRMPARGENVNGSGHDWRQVVNIQGTPMRAVMDQILTAIKQAGYRPSDLSRSRKAPFLLSEEVGVRLGLLMLAVKPLRKSSRMTDISEQIQSMASEEAYYWFSKMTDHQVGRRSQKAMRILLAKE
jgi:DNA-binding LacI/PurR family transcriptional regulator